jgi:hypothetical protein
MSQKARILDRARTPQPRRGLGNLVLLAAPGARAVQGSRRAVWAAATRSGPKQIMCGCGQLHRSGRTAATPGDWPIDQLVAA